MRNLKHFSLLPGTAKMKTPVIATDPPLLSAYAIARKIQRSPQSVLDALERLGITPQLSLPSGKYYTDEVADIVASGMRRPNGANNGVNKEG